MDFPCILCFQNIVKHQERYLVEGRGKFNVGEELSRLPFNVPRTQWRSQLEIMIPPCRAEGATPLGGFGGMPPRENFQM